MPNQYTKLTASNIMRKINRRTNPVTSIAQLAREFGVNTSYLRHHDWYGREGRTDTAAPASFRRKVKALVGEQVYNDLRRSQHISTF